MTSVLTDVHTDEMVKIAREQVDAFSHGDWELLRGTLASDSRYKELGTQGKIEGPEKIVELFKAWKAAFPDGAGAVTTVVSSANTDALEVTWKGTHTGPLEMLTERSRRPASARRRPLPSSSPPRATRSTRAATPSTR
jgi:hypothetical protein